MRLREGCFLEIVGSRGLGGQHDLVTLDQSALAPYSCVYIGRRHPLIFIRWRSHLPYHFTSLAMRAHQTTCYVFRTAASFMLLLASTTSCTSLIAGMVNTDVLTTTHRKKPHLFANAGFEAVATPNWPPNIEGGSPAETTLRGVLNRHFGLHASGCELTPNSSGKDFVPNDIERFTRTNLDQRVAQLDVAGRNLMFYLHTSAERDLPFDQIVPVPSRVFTRHTADAGGLALGGEFLIASQEGFPAWASRRNCAAYLHAALQANLSVPPASLRTALESDMNHRSTLVVVEGWFVSPLTAVVQGTDRRSNYARMVLWDLYRTEPDLRGGAHYLKEFRGLMVARALDRESSRRVEASIDLNQPLPVGNVTASVAGGYKASNLFSVSDWTTIIYDLFGPAYPRERAYATLPSADELRVQFSSISVSHGQDRAMSNGVDHTHWVDIEGIPDRMCNAGYWQLHDLGQGVYRTSPAVTLRARPREENVCRFEVSGRPVAALFPGSSRVNVSYTIRTTEQASVAGQRLGRRIEIPIETVNEPRPALGIAQPVAMLHTNAPERKFSLRWILNVTFVDANNTVRYDGEARTRDEDVTLVCGGESFAASAEGFARSVGGNRFYEVVIQTGATLSHEILDVTTPSQQPCTVNLTMSVPLRGSAEALVTLNAVRLEFPSSRPQAPSSSSATRE